MAGFFENVDTAAGAGGGIGGTLGFLGASMHYARQKLDLAAMGRIGIVTAYFAAAGVATGVLIQGFAQL